MRLEDESICMSKVKMGRKRGRNCGSVALGVAVLSQCMCRCTGVVVRPRCDISVLPAQQKAGLHSLQENNKDVSRSKFRCVLWFRGGDQDDHNDNVTTRGNYTAQHKHDKNDNDNDEDEEVDMNTRGGGVGGVTSLPYTPASDDDGEEDHDVEELGSDEDSTHMRRMQEQHQPRQLVRPEREDRGSKPLRTLKKLEAMLDETDYSAATDTFITSPTPEAEPPPALLNQRSAYYRQPPQQAKPKTKAQYRRQQRLEKQRRRWERERAVTQKSMSEAAAAAAAATDDEWTDYSDDGLGYTLPNLPIYVSDAEPPEFDPVPAPNANINTNEPTPPPQTHQPPPPPPPSVMPFPYQYGAPYPYPPAPFMQLPPPMQYPYTPPPPYPLPPSDYFANPYAAWTAAAAAVQNQGQGNAYYGPHQQHQSQPQSSAQPSYSQYHQQPLQQNYRPNEENHDYRLRQQRPNVQEVHGTRLQDRSPSPPPLKTDLSTLQTSTMGAQDQQADQQQQNGDQIQDAQPEPSAVQQEKNGQISHHSNVTMEFGDLSPPSTTPHQNHTEEGNAVTNDRLLPTSESTSVSPPYHPPPSAASSVSTTPPAAARTTPHAISSPPSLSSPPTLSSHMPPPYHPGYWHPYPLPPPTSTTPPLLTNTSPTSTHTHVSQALTTTTASNMLTPARAASLAEAGTNLTFDSLQKLLYAMLSVVVLAYCAVSPRTLPPVAYNSHFKHNLQICTLLFLAPMGIILSVMDAKEVDVNTLVHTFYTAFTMGYVVSFVMEILLTTLLRLGVFAIWEPEVFRLTPTVPLPVLPWVLRENAYRPKRITLFAADFVTSCVASSVVEEFVKLKVVQWSIRLPRNFVWRRRYKKTSNNKKQKKKKKKRRKKVLEPVVRHEDEPEVTNINCYVTHMLASSLGLKLADSVRRVLMYTKSHQSHRGVYAFCRGLFPIHELCGTLTALQLAKRDVLGVSMPLWQLLFPGAFIHGMANFRGMKPVFKWNSSTPWSEMQMTPLHLADDSTFVELVSKGFAKLIWLSILLRVLGSCIKNYYRIGRQAVKRITTFAENRAAFVAELEADVVLKKQKKDEK